VDNCGGAGAIMTEIKHTQTFTRVYLYVGMNTRARKNFGEGRDAAKKPGKASSRPLECDAK